jgi:hypothetical protein
VVNKKELEKYIKVPEIKQFLGLQVFEFHGKDARGCDFTVQLSPVDALAYLQDPPTVKADRVKMYLGGNPAHIDRIYTDIDITIGAESSRISAAAMAYIPNGVSYRHQVVRKPRQNSWVFSLTLPPPYQELGKADEPTKKKTGKASRTKAKSGINQYKNLVVRQVKQKWPMINPLASDFVAGSRDFMKNIEGARPNFALYYIMRAGMFPETPHSHHCDEYLMFLPTDPHDMKNLGAVIEVAYGEEWKKVVFSQSALVFFPKELQHCPIHVKKMERPFLFGHFWPMGEESHILPAK